MKIYNFNSSIIILVLLYFHNLYQLTEIPLKRALSHKKEHFMLYQLSKMQEHNYSSFLEMKELPLHQHVIAKQKISSYYGDVGVGIITDCQKLKQNEDPGKLETQLFKVLFDTGSTEFWVPDGKCNTDRCLMHNRFQDSCTQREFEEGGMKIRYMSGEVSGRLGKDTVLMGDIVVPNQIIGLAQTVDVPLLDVIEWDGIVGLAQPNINSLRQNIDPIFDKMMKLNLLTSRGEKNQFSQYAGQENGSIIFGGADLRYKRSSSEEFQQVPISVEDQWTVSLYDVKITFSTGYRFRSYIQTHMGVKITKSQMLKFRNRDRNRLSTTKVKTSSKIQFKKTHGESVLCSEGCNTIVDTGTQLIQGPEKQFTPVLSEIKGSRCEDKANMPDIMFAFLGKEDEVVEFVLTPDDQVLEFSQGGNVGCVIGFATDAQDTGWTIGQTFLKPYLSLYDRDSNSIGFVRANMDPEDKPNTKAIHSMRFKQQITKKIQDDHQ